MTTKKTKADSTAKYILTIDDESRCFLVFPRILNQSQAELLKEVSDYISDTLHVEFYLTEVKDGE